MKKLYFICLGLISILSYSQNSQVYRYYVYYHNSYEAAKFNKSSNGMSYYIGERLDLKDFFDNYDIVSFEQAFSNYPIENILRVYLLETYDSDLMRDFIDNFPMLVEKYEDLTEEVIELTYYTNDYGLTNPNGSQGINIDRRDLDYIDVSKAWDINTGEGVKIGISDGRIKPDDLDFVNKVTFLPEYPYSNMGYEPNNIVSIHGTSVAAIAAAKGNNGYGSVGVCMECEILAVGYGNYNHLISLVNAGARVINMSWTSSYYSAVHQDIINYLVNDLGVVLVASAGNRTSNQTSVDFLCSGASYSTSQGGFVPNFTGLQYFYPASYDNVISVSSIEHYYPNAYENGVYCCTSVLGNIGLAIEDSFAGSLLIDDLNNPLGLVYNGFPQYCQYNGTYHLVSPNGLVNTYTFNENVDILAPANRVYNHTKLAEEGIVDYHSYGGTSSAAPYVSGTTALMISVDNCISPQEVENIIKLTAKDVVNLPVNQYYKDYIGAGKLETGEAVEFVDEMIKSNGIAKIKGHTFNRFSFNLERINNKLNIENVTFKEDCVASFTSKNQINLLPGTNLKPNSNGYVNLKINSNIDVSCQPNQSIGQNKSRLEEKKLEIANNTISVFPNPNNGLFTILFSEIKYDKIELKVYDINGRIILNELIYKEDLSSNTWKINIQNYAKGIYFVNIDSIDNQKVFKIIKN